MHAGDFRTTGPVDLAVLVVTYRSADDIDGLLDSLRAAVEDLAVRVVVADNASTDGTAQQVARHQDVVMVGTGGNLGYAAGVNVALAAARTAGEAPAYLVLNPDLRVRPGALTALLSAAAAHPEAGIVAPRIEDNAGELTYSVFHEPSPLRAVADAVLGPAWATRPAAFSEWDRDPTHYRSAHRVDCASGAALLLSAELLRAVGEWDERFFLYSEEVDYCRRARDAGFEVLYAPEAVVQHAQGGSGTSEQLDALLAVNRVRYVRKHGGGSAAVYRSAMALGEALRAALKRGGSHRLSARMLRDEDAWDTLPAAGWDGPAAAASTPGRETGAEVDHAASGSASPAAVASVIIPAHNEEAVIGRTLARLAPLAAAGVLDVRVVCNGCTDATAQVARSVPGIRVTEVEEASKTVALNVGDRLAAVFPRIYLDADIELPTAALPPLLRALDAPGVLAARPAFEYRTAHSSWPVRAYYRARLRMPRMSRALWGAGVFALNERGHALVAPFPAVIADDLHADAAIPEEAKAFPPTVPVTVRMPKTVPALLGLLARARRGAAQQGVDSGASTATDLVRTVCGPASLVDAVAFAALTLVARRRVAGASSRVPGGRESGAGSSGAVWERDETSRGGP